MAAYTFLYRDFEQKKIKQESVFMKTLTGAKRSACINAPAYTFTIEIFDLMGKCLSRKTHEQHWVDAS